MSESESETPPVGGGGPRVRPSAQPDDVEGELAPLIPPRVRPPTQAEPERWSPELLEALEREYQRGPYDGKSQGLPWPTFLALYRWVHATEGVAAQLTDLRGAHQHLIDVAGEALGTDPADRSPGCVQALADWSHQLRDEFADLRGERDHLSQQIDKLLAQLKLQDGDIRKLYDENVALRGAGAALQQQVERIVKRAGKRSTLTLSTFDIEELRVTLARDEVPDGRSEVGRTDSADGGDVADHQRDQGAAADGRCAGAGDCGDASGNRDAVGGERPQVTASDLNWVRAQRDVAEEKLKQADADLARLRSSGQALVQQWRDDADRLPETDAFDGDKKYLRACADALRAALQEQE